MTEISDPEVVEICLRLEAARKAVDQALQDLHDKGYAIHDDGLAARRRVAVQWPGGPEMPGLELESSGDRIYVQFSLDARASVSAERVRYIDPEPEES